LIMRKRELETELLGYGSAQLKGPHLADPDPRNREKNTLALSREAARLARGEGTGFLSAKTSHDPALIRGFARAGFEVAEIGACLAGPVVVPAAAEDREGESRKFFKSAGITVANASETDPGTVVSDLGELFHDGHHLHGPFLPEGFSGKLWSRVLERELGRGAPSLLAFDNRQNRILGIAAADLRGTDATLTVLHVNEERRREGLGRELLLALFRTLADAGAKTMALETSSHNIPAINLYLSLGLKHTAPNITLHLDLKNRRGGWR
jgi:ribosomal protein S18 acetylase RimI-like enzyme